MDLSQHALEKLFVGIFGLLKDILLCLNKVFERRQTLFHFPCIAAGVLVNLVLREARNKGGGMRGRRKAGTVYFLSPSNSSSTAALKSRSRK